MNQKLKILHLEDMPADAELVARELKKGNLDFEKLTVNNKKDFASALQHFDPAIVISDHSLPSFNSIEALKMVKSSGIDVPFILVTATVSEEFAVSILQQGGDDYILKDNLSRLPSAVKQALEKYDAKAAKIKAEEQLFVAHQRLLFHLENSPLGYIEWDKTRRIKSMSQRAVEIFGWTLEELNEHRTQGVRNAHPDDIEMLSHMEKELLDGKVVRSKMQFRSYTKSGSIIWCECFNSALKNENGEVITILSLVEDVTLRKTGEETLVKNELRFREFFETAPEALFVVDPFSRVFVDYNDNALNLVKYTGPELLTKTPADISPPVQPGGEQSREKMRAYFEETINGNYPIFEWIIIDNEGTKIDCEIRLSLLANSERPLIRASVLDITRRVQLEKKLEKEQLQKQMEITEAVIVAQEQERTYLGEELHDNINQILAASKLYLDHAITAGTLREDLLIGSRGYTLSAMEEIRKLSRSLLPPSLGSTSLKVAITELVKTIQAVKDIEFYIDWNITDEDKLPQKMRLAIFRMVQEQMNNILKHAEALNVYIVLTQMDGSIKMVIRDDGKGFDTNEHGEGIGLKNISSRASVFNGTMEVHSQPGGGCEVVVNLQATDGTGKKMISAFQ